jgi:hypothetical protein
MLVEEAKRHYEKSEDEEEICEVKDENEETSKAYHNL